MYRSDLAYRTFFLAMSMSTPVAGQSMHAESTLHRFLRLFL